MRSQTLANSSNPRRRAFDRISPSSLGKTIRRLRKRRRLTQDELSERVGLKRPELTRIEKGESLVSLETMLRIFKELDVNAEEVALGVTEAS